MEPSNKIINTLTLIAKIFFIGLLLQFFLQTFVTFKLWLDGTFRKLIWMRKEIIIIGLLGFLGRYFRKNKNFKSFFEKFPNVKTLAEASAESVFEIIKSCSYPNNKAKNLLGMAKTLQDQYGGVVPDTRGELMKLPGAGRKTANVMLSVAFGKPAFAVDTHVFRVAARIGLSKNAKNPVNTGFSGIK